MAHTPRGLREDAFTLIEVIVAMVVILVGVLGTVALLDRASAQSAEAKTRQTANALIRDIIETSQGVAYANLTDAAAKTTLQANGFPDDEPSTASTWEIKRNGITFTMSVTACVVDDPRDGLGTHASTYGFCSDSPAGTGDSAPDDYRRVILTVTPPAALGGPITQTTVVGSNRITNPGGTGPGGGTATSNEIKDLKITSPTLYAGHVAPCLSSASCTYPTTTSTLVTPKTVTFRTTTAYTAQNVKYTIDGQPMATVSGPGTTFDWTWSLPDSQPDGNYVVAAQIYDSTGNTAISMPSPLVVTVNRYAPDPNAFAPTAAGRNPLWQNMPEIETYPTNNLAARVDRDITGFMATRQINGGTSTVVCQTYTPNLRGCQDTSAPNCCAGTVTYRITPTALNPDGTQQTGGITAASRDVNLQNTRPNEPENITVARQGTRVTLSWTNPVGSGDPDTGDCIKFFRIYRKSEGTAPWEYTDRVERTIYGNAALPCGLPGEFTNSVTLIESTSVTKRYRVTSVDTNLAESPKEQVFG